MHVLWSFIVLLAVMVNNLVLYCLRRCGRCGGGGGQSVAVMSSLVNQVQHLPAAVNQWAALQQGLDDIVQHHDAVSVRPASPDASDHHVRARLALTHIV